MKFYEFDENQKRVDIFNERFYPRKIGKKTEWYRNVTTILGIINPGYALTEWLKNVGHNAEIIIDRAGKFGSAFHLLIEKFLKEENISYHDLEGDAAYKTALWERFNLWLEWFKESDLAYKKTGLETIVYSDKHKYAGTVDFLGQVDGELQICDWKSGSMIGNKEALQMVAYMRAVEEMYSIRPTQANLVHVPLKRPNKKGYRVKVVPNSDELFDLFLSTKKVFDMENKDSPKLLTLPLEVSIKSLTKE